MAYDFVDTHGFAGGFSCGATQAGMRLVGKREDESGFGVPLLEANREFLGDAWEAEAVAPSAWTPVKADVVIATPPCSAFSSMTAGITGKHGIEAPANQCMRDVMSYAVKVRPQVIAMESVGQAFTKGLSLMRELARFVNEETGLTYHTTHVMQNNLSTGGCTKRKRYFLVLSRVPFGVESYDLGDKLPTVGDAFADLVDLPLSWEPQPYVNEATWWSAKLRSKSGLVDGHVSPTGTHTLRLEEIVTGEKGVEWKPGESDLQAVKRYYETHGDLPESWHYKSAGRDITRAEYLVQRNFVVGGFSKPRHWPWDQPGRVINGAGPYQVWHPNNRFITQRETARLLGFPDDWVVGTAQKARDLNAFWGKGTSVSPARWLMEWVKASLDGNPGANTGEELEGGDKFIDVSTDWKRLEHTIKPVEVSA